MLRLVVLLSIATALIVMPAMGAVFLSHQTRVDALYRGSAVRYLHHSPAPRNSSHLMSNLGYDAHSILRDGLPVPRQYLANLPQSLTELSVRDRKRVFTHALLPLVLRANEMILADRTRVINLQYKVARDHSLTPLEANWLADLSRRYKVGVLGGAVAFDFEKLLRRVDIVPPSLALAQAAIESGWGTSRFAQSGNSLYGQWTWGNSGMIPKQRGANQDHLVASYDYLIQSVVSYALNLNTHAAYAGFRQRRATMRERGETPEGMRLADTLQAYSARGDDYVQEIRAIITGNRFQDFETASLEPEWWAQR